MPDANMPIQHWLPSLAGRVALPGPLEDLELAAADGGIQMAVTAVHRAALIRLGTPCETDSVRCIRGEVEIVRCGQCVVQTTRCKQCEAQMV